MAAQLPPLRTGRFYVVQPGTMQPTPSHLRHMPPELQPRSLTPTGHTPLLAQPRHDALARRQQESVTRARHRPMLLDDQPPDAATLRTVLASRLRGEQVIVVSNRQPCSHELLEGVVHIRRPASGLVTAVEPVITACAGTWIAHGSGSADHLVVDDRDVWQVPSEVGNYSLRRIWLSAEEVQGHCDGFSNAGLWPLCHMVHVRPVFREQDWCHYQRVNQRFADAVVAQANRADPIVLVQDYHLALVPTMVRALLPRATIVSFWHIPWAHPEQMGICPWLPALVHGLLGSDIVGFQTPQHQRNFVESARAGSHHNKVDHPCDVVRGAHRSRVRAYPISIAWPSQRQMDALPSVAQCRKAAAARWSVPAHRRLIVGIDRLDYTKGLLERLHALEHLLEHYPQWRGAVQLIQVAAPSRSTLTEYAGFRAQLMAEVDRINARFATTDAPLVLLLDTHHDRAAVDALYRAADVCLVTSLHDGMNLVCKEFVAARDDLHGVLVLSQFAGAAAELPDALVVNPYHTAQVAQALHVGLQMPAQEQRRRMSRLRATVQERNVYRWATSMLLDAAEVRAPVGAGVPGPQLMPNGPQKNGTLAPA